MRRNTHYHILYHKHDLICNNIYTTHDMTCNIIYSVTYYIMCGIICWKIYSRKRRDVVHFFLKRFYLFIFYRGEWRERGKHQCVITSHALPTYPTTQACALDWESHQRPFDSQASIQSLSHTSQGCVYF